MINRQPNQETGLKAIRVPIILSPRQKISDLIVAGLHESFQEITYCMESRRFYGIRYVVDDQPCAFLREQI